MEVSRDNTATIIKNMRAEGHESRADYLELMQQRELELMAQVERLRYWLEAENESLKKTHNDNLYPQAVDVVLQENPQQSLAEHDAFLLDFVIDSIPKPVSEITGEDILEYANQLRQQAGKG
jgi:hypothetical protein